LQRIREYIEGHLAENIELETLADIAGLSKWHFARAFKQSVGTPPHFYLIQRRLERAQELLAETDLSLAQIALRPYFCRTSKHRRWCAQWFVVPDSAVVTEPNRFGPAVVWPFMDAMGVTQIRCFLPGNAGWSDPSKQREHYPHNFLRLDPAVQVLLGHDELLCCSTQCVIRGMRVKAA
jgi:AraC-like DNA-binding protein